ncbi:MAG: SCO family protein [Deltaproteobacteria bacterium]|nr:SCO family protein [Deltaproteobacteria bacterium]
MTMRSPAKPRTSRLLICITFYCGALCIGLLACQSRNHSTEQHYELKGQVVSVDPQRRSATIAHEEIPGYMEAMTMPFTLKDQWVYRVLTAGDHVQATLVVAGKRTWLEDMVITKDSPASADAGTPAEAPNLGAQTGATVPNFSLINQDQQAISFQQYHGKVLLLTFIYTRCPLANFCPQMSTNFAALHQALRQDPELYARTHLLCVSFDPTFDTPAVLRSYEVTYAGSDTPETFAHWEFASGTAQQVDDIAQFFGLVHVPQTDQFTHSLRTVVITPEGKVFKVYRGNDWTVTDLLRDVRQLLTR